MARDIEEFLRRAAERRQQQKNQGQKPPPARPVRPAIPEIEVEIVQPRDQQRKKQKARRHSTAVDFTLKWSTEKTKQKN